MTEQERQRVLKYLQRSLQRSIDREILIHIAIANDINVDEFLYEFDLLNFPSQNHPKQPSP